MVNSVSGKVRGQKICIYCLKRPRKITGDHFIPKILGGAKESNIVPCCLKCNKHKGDSLPEDWCTSEQMERVKEYLGHLPSSKKPKLIAKNLEKESKKRFQESERGELWLGCPRMEYLMRGNKMIKKLRVKII